MKRNLDAIEYGTYGEILQEEKTEGLDVSRNENGNSNQWSFLMNYEKNVGNNSYRKVPVGTIIRRNSTYY